MIPKIIVMKLFLSIMLLLATTFTYAQVGIGTTTPSSASMLEISSGQTGDYRGLMPPRVPDTAAQLSINPAVADAGLMVFVESTGCLDLWNGTAWENVNCTGGSVNLWVNEFHYTNGNGADINEFIEVAGVAGIDLSEYYIIRYTAAGNSYNVVLGLSGVIDDEGNGYGAVSFSVAPLQNGPNDGFALVGPNGLVQFLSYEGTLTGTGAPVAGITSEDVGFAENNGTAIGDSIQLTGTGNTYTDFTWTAPVAESPGTLNAGQIIN